MVDLQSVGTVLVIDTIYFSLAKKMSLHLPIYTVFHWLITPTCNGKPQNLCLN